MSILDFCVYNITKCNIFTLMMYFKKLKKVFVGIYPASHYNILYTYIQIISYFLNI